MHFGVHHLQDIFPSREANLPIHSHSHKVPKDITYDWLPAPAQCEEKGNKLLASYLQTDLF